MVGAPAAADAVARARSIPQLRVGLHVVLADGAAVSAPDSVAALADGEGHMDGRMFARGVRYFALPRVRRQLRAEIRAQFEAFSRTGLRLEPLWFARGSGGGLAAGAGAALLKPWVGLMKMRLRSAGVFHNDQIFGIAASGAMDEAKLLQAIDGLPPGVSEIYLHPATAGQVIAPSMGGYRHSAELDALLSPKVRAAIEQARIARGGFGDAPRPAAPMG